MAKEVITFINCFFESLQFAKQFRSENGFLQREACGIRSKCKHIRTPLLASPHTHLQSLSRFALSQSKGQAFFQLLFWGPRALGVACIGLIKAGRMPLPCTASYISGNMVSCQIQEVRLGRNRVFQTYFYKQNSQRRSLRRTRSCHIFGVDEFKLAMRPSFPHCRNNRVHAIAPVHGPWTVHQVCKEDVVVQCRLVFAKWGGQLVLK